MSDWQLVHLVFVKVLFFKPFRLLHFFDGGNGYTHEMTLEWCLRAGIWLSYAYGFSSPVAGARTSYIVEYGCKYNHLDEVNHSQHVLSAPHRGGEGVLGYMATCKSWRAHSGIGPAPAHEPEAAPLRPLRAPAS